MGPIAQCLRPELLCVIGNPVRENRISWPHLSNVLCAIWVFYEHISVEELRYGCVTGIRDTYSSAPRKYGSYWASQLSVSDNYTVWYARAVTHNVASVDLFCDSSIHDGDIVLIVCRLSTPQQKNLLAVSSTRTY